MLRETGLIITSAICLGYVTAVLLSESLELELDQEMLDQLEIFSRINPVPTIKARLLWCKKLNLSPNDMEKWLEWKKGQSRKRRKRDTLESTVNPASSKYSQSLEELLGLMKEDSKGNKCEEVPKSRKRRKRGLERVGNLPRASVEQQARTYEYFSPEQIHQLKMLYKFERYPSILQKREMAEQLKVSLPKVDYWFASQRKRERRNRMGLDGEEGKPVKRIGPELREKLETLYQKSFYPNRTERRKLAEELGLTERRVLGWFSDRRTNARKRAMRIKKQKEEGIYRKQGIFRRATTFSTTSRPQKKPYYDYYETTNNDIEDVMNYLRY